jgi:hypothetical protein
MAEVASEGITAGALQWVDCNSVAPKHAVRLPTRHRLLGTHSHVYLISGECTDKILSEATTVSVRG